VCWEGLAHDCGSVPSRLHVFHLKQSDKLRIRWLWECEHSIQKIRGIFEGVRCYIGAPPQNVSMWKGENISLENKKCGKRMWESRRSGKRRRPMQGVPSAITKFWVCSGMRGTVSERNNFGWWKMLFHWQLVFSLKHFSCSEPNECFPAQDEEVAERNSKEFKCFGKPLAVLCTKGLWSLSLTFDQGFHHTLICKCVAKQEYVKGERGSNFLSETFCLSLLCVITCV
jgi:hypothetical protein